VLKNAKPGVIYTSKQTSAGDIYKFETAKLYMSWQVKYGVSKAFGVPALKVEVEKAILHNSTDADIQFVIVIVAQKLAKFFLAKMKSEEEEKFCNIIRSNSKYLAIQFNPGYVMKIVHKRKKSNQPPPKKAKVEPPKKTGQKKGKTTKPDSKITKWPIPNNVQVVVLFEDGIYELLGQPIYQYLLEKDVLDTAVLNAMDLPFPDPIMSRERLPAVQDEEHEVSEEYEEDEDNMVTEQSDVEEVMHKLIEEDSYDDV